MVFVMIGGGGSSHLSDLVTIVIEWFVWKVAILLAPVECAELPVDMAGYTDAVSPRQLIWNIWCLHPKARRVKKSC
jgi:hypothetical protein